MRAVLLAYSLNVGTPTILYFILAFLGVAALAIYLIAITFILRKVSFILGTTLIGVRAIAARLQPVAKVVGGIAGNVGVISSALGVALGEEEAGPTRTARPARPAPAPARPAPAPRPRPARVARGASTVGPARRPRTAIRIPPPPPPPAEEEPEVEEVVEEPEEEMAAAEPEEATPVVTPVAAATGPARFVPGGEPGAWRFE